MGVTPNGTIRIPICAVSAPQRPSQNVSRGTTITYRVPLPTKLRMVCAVSANVVKCNTEWYYKADRLCQKCTHTTKPKPSCRMCRKRVKLNTNGLCSKCTNASTPQTKPVKWDKFDTTDKGRLELSFYNRTVSSTMSYKKGGTARSAWVPRNGSATAKVRVDSVCPSGGVVQIGVIEERGSYKALFSRQKMTQNPHAWCYASSFSHSWNSGHKGGEGSIYHAGNCEKRNVPLLTGGSMVVGGKSCTRTILTVTLSGGTVTFKRNDRQIHSFKLPRGNARIALGVSLNYAHNDAKVTLI